MELNIDICRVLIKQSISNYVELSEGFIVAIVVLYLWEESGSNSIRDI